MAEKKPTTTNSNPSAETIEVHLRQPAVAAFWAWLLPGAGHFYQRRYAKGVIFLVCILFTYFFGLALGGGRVVYASFERNDFRWQYVLQLGVGAPALPALVQSYRVRNEQESLWPHWMTPPTEVRPEQRDELADWHYEYHAFFEMGTLYTMIAGLLNILAIYDAFAGPLIIVPPERERGPPKRRKKNESDKADSKNKSETGTASNEATAEKKSSEKKTTETT